MSRDDRQGDYKQARAKQQAASSFDLKGNYRIVCGFTCSSVCRKRSDISPAKARQQTNKQRRSQREVAASGQGKDTAGWGNLVVSQT